jgi:hypothetical protein
MPRKDRGTRGVGTDDGTAGAAGGPTRVSEERDA